MILLNKVTQTLDRAVILCPSCGKVWKRKNNTNTAEILPELYVGTLIYIYGMSVIDFIINFELSDK